jgi:uncharacterized protein YndB with AHSA1/START domain
MSRDLMHKYQVFIQATPQQVWDAITSSDFTTKYYYGSPIESDWKAGSPYTMFSPDGQNVFIDGKVLEAEPSRRLVQTFNAKWSPDFADEPETRVTWEIEQMGDACKLTLTHEGFTTESKLYHGVDDGGWSQILSGMKTLLETGRPLVVEEPASANAG